MRRGIALAIAAAAIGGIALGPHLQAEATSEDRADLERIKRNQERGFQAKPTQHLDQTSAIKSKVGWPSIVEAEHNRFQKKRQLKQMKVNPRASKARRRGK